MLISCSKCNDYLTYRGLRKEECGDFKVVLDCIPCERAVVFNFRNEKPSSTETIGLDQVKGCMGTGGFDPYFFTSETKLE